VQARGKGLAAAINVALWTVAAIVGVWAWIVPRPYAAAVWANVLTPLLGVPLVFWARGKVTVIYFGKDEPSQISAPFLFCGIALCLRACDYPIFGANTVFLYAAILSLPLAAIAWIYSDARAKGFHKILNTLAMIVITVLYGAGAIITLDRVLDTTPPKLGRSKILEKYISHGKYTSYRISVSPPEAGDPRLDFTVGQSAYDRVVVGDVLSIGEHRGAFGVRWFDLRRRLPGQGVADLFPAAARAKSIGGVTQMKCLVTADGRLSDCAILFECPAGHGFGEAALRSAPYFKMRPQTKDGRPVGGGQVIIPMKWKVAGAEIPAECASPPKPAKP
jgi:hypothetical protein